MDTPPRSDLPVPPGDYLAQVLREKHITRREFARRLGMRPEAVRRLIVGELPITPALADDLARVTGVPADLWLALEGDYRWALKRQEVIAS